MTKKVFYVALSTIVFEHVDSKETIQAAAKGNGYHGVFSGLSVKNAKELLNMGAIREASVGEIAEARLGDADLDDGLDVVDPAPTPDPAQVKAAAKAAADKAAADKAAPDKAAAEKPADKTDLVG